MFFVDKQMLTDCQQFAARQALGLDRITDRSRPHLFIRCQPPANPPSLFWAWDVRLPPQAPHQPITKSMTRSTTKTGSNTSIRITTATTTTNNNSSSNSNKSCNINCCNTSSNNSNSNSIFLTWRVYQMKPFSSLKCRDGHPRYLEELVLFRKTMVPMDEGSSFHSDLSIML